MIGPYIQAIETQLDWLRKTSPEPVDRMSQVARALGNSPQHLSQQNARLHKRIASADTFFMNRHFCELTDIAFSDVPDGLRFEASWLQSHQGFLFRETPLLLEDTELGKIQFDTFVWSRDSDGRVVVQWFAVVAEQIAGSETDIAFSGEVYLEDGQSLRESQLQGRGHHRVASPWLYCAFHLMSQRMSVIVEQRVDRAVRRRAEKSNEIVPQIVKVISLRRLEEDRGRAAPHEVNWHWQWEVRGHWRNQFYPTENIHKPVFVEAYIKGPTDKPFKSPGLKLFAAVR